MAITVTEVEAFVGQLNCESERGLVLISTGFLEEQLKEVLIFFMKEGNSAEFLLRERGGPLSSFDTRISLCYALGLIAKDEHDDLHMLRDIRNNFAHDFRVNFNTKSVIDRCGRLKHKSQGYHPPDAKPSAAANFITTAMYLILTLTNRPGLVAKQRRVPWPQSHIAGGDPEAKS